MTVTGASKICTFIVKHLEKELHTTVTPSMTLSEVGIDSYSLFELQLILEIKYFPDAAISFPMLQLLENTVSQVADFVAAHAREQTGNCMVINLSDRARV